MYGGFRPAAAVHFAMPNTSPEIPAHSTQGDTPISPIALAYPVALITGAGSGIGRAVALGLARKGWRILAVGRRIQPLRETISLCEEAQRELAQHEQAQYEQVKSERTQAPGGAAFSCDVGDAAACRDAVNHAYARLGRLDALINNAGHAPKLPIQEHTIEVIAETFAINAIGPANMMVQAISRWTASDANNKQAFSPAIVNVGSMSTIDPFPGFFAYAASKASLNLLTRSCHNELSSAGVRCFTVSPGAVETPLLRSIFPAEVLPTSKTLTPEAVAIVIIECVLGTRDAQQGDVIVVPSP